MNQQKIGRFIQERRKEKELTQVELAEKLGVSNRTISKWENGRCLPDYSVFQDLCKELDITINELLAGEKLNDDNYQNKFEENFISIVDYNNKMRNMKIKRAIGFIAFLIIAYILYKAFIVFFYYNQYKDETTDERTFPYNKNIKTVQIHENGKANTKVLDAINIYIPDEFKLVTDKAKSSFVTDNCVPFIKNLKDDKTFDAMILVCKMDGNIYNLDYHGIESTLFPWMDVFSLLRKYNIKDTVDLVKFYEKNYNFKQNIFTSSDEIKMNYIARRYSQLTLPSYDNFYYLENDLKGYSIETFRTYSKYHLQTRISKTRFYDERIYGISFFNNEQYFNHDNSFEIINSISIE